MSCRMDNELQDLNKFWNYYKNTEYKLARSLDLVFYLLEGIWWRLGLNNEELSKVCDFVWCK